MKQWHAIMHKALTEGVERPDRTGVGTMALFGEQLVFDNSVTFPAVTTKELKFGQVKAELAAFIHGESTLEGFHKWGCRIWDGNAEQTAGSKFKPAFAGDLGRIYGVQWRNWHTYVGSSLPMAVDQLKELVHGLKANPYGRRHLVTAWNPGDLDDM